MKILLKATKVSKQLSGLLSPGPYKVHSRFSHGFNISLGDKLCFIGLGSINIPPMGVVLEYGLDKGFTGLSDDSFRWDDRLNKFESNEIIIDLNEAEIIDNSLLSKSKNIPLENLTILLSSLDDNIMTGFGETSGDLSNLRVGYVKNLCSKFNSTDTIDIEKTLKQWIGRGIGLTPSGDDFLQGLMFVNDIVPILGHVFYEELKKLILIDGLTTDISLNYYRCALSKMYSSTLIELYQAIELGIPKEIRRCVYELLELGNTSGADILSGILTGVKMHLIYKNNSL